MTFKNPRNVIARNVLVAKMLKERSLELYNTQHEHFTTLVMPPHIHPVSMLCVAGSTQIRRFIVDVCEAMYMYPNKTRSPFMGVFHMRMAEDHKSVSVWSPKYITQMEDGTRKNTFQLTTVHLGDGWVGKFKEQFRYLMTHQYAPKEEADKIKALQKEARTRKRKRV